MLTYVKPTHGKQLRRGELGGGEQISEGEEGDERMHETMRALGRKGGEARSRQIRSEGVSRETRRKLQEAGRKGGYARWHGGEGGGGGRGRKRGVCALSSCAYVILIVFMGL
jgi:hypothetical protein